VGRTSRKVSISHSSTRRTTIGASAMARLITRTLPQDF
jgi:hypothetical protein